MWLRSLPEIPWRSEARSQMSLQLPNNLYSATLELSSGTVNQPSISTMIPTSMKADCAVIQALKTDKKAFLILMLLCSVESKQIMERIMWCFVRSIIDH